jgi:protein involved in polysaccharide export with SLBB domain
VYPLPDKQTRALRRDQQAREIEHNQDALRASIEESKRLVDQSEAMILRHRRECEEDELQSLN